MFDPKQSQIGDAYLETTDIISKTEEALAKVLIELAKIAIKKIKEGWEASKIAVEVGKDTYNLVPDESTPGAYKWDKVDLTNSTQSISDNQTKPFTDYQAQTFTTWLLEDVASPNLENNYQQSGESTLKITAYIESSGQEENIVIYEKNNEGECTTNLVTEILTPDEIIDVAYESVVKLLPPSSEIVKASTTEYIDNPETSKFYYNSDLEEIVFAGDVNYSSPPNEYEFFIDEDLPPPDSYPSITNENINELPSPSAFSATLIQTNENATNQPKEKGQPGVLIREASENYQPNPEVSDAAITTIPKNQEQNEDEQVTSFNKKQSSEETEAPKPKFAASHTYEQVADSQGVEPAAQQWAKQVEVPVYKIVNIFAQKERFNGENKEIAKTATELLKKYGTVEQDGSRIYRSDAFVVRQDGDKFSIHRRSDELQGWKDSLIDFKLNSKGEPKITNANKEMLGVERQEFLMVAEKLADNGKLPDLGKDDIRDIGNTLGSLAPAGTIKTLETFKQSEILTSLNNILTQAKKDEVTVGDYTIKRSLNKEGDKATFQAFKTSEERGTQELVRFDLTKDNEGNVSRQVTKINISDYDINQIKFIAQNTAKLDYDQIFDSKQPSASNSEPLDREVPIKNIGDIPVKVHPYITQEWSDMTKKGGLEWSGAMNQGNDEILQKIKDNDGKLSIAEQREMYFKIMTHKASEAEKQGENTMEFVPLKEIMKDLQEWRGEEIKQQYTPIENTSPKQRETTATTQKAKEMEI
jgi:hypothetical protein